MEKSIGKKGVKEKLGMNFNKSLRYEEMLPHEIVKRREACPVVYLPLGGLEWHGEHLAVGNDALKAQKLCELAARKGGGVAFPPLWYGEPRDVGLMETSHDQDGKIRKKMRLPGKNFKLGIFGTTGEEQLDFYRKLILHVFIQIRTLGFKAIVILTGHYPILNWIQPVIREFNQKYNDCQSYAGIEYHYGPDPETRRRVGGDHAAKWETSYLMALRPECVDLSVYRGRNLKEKLVGVIGEDPRITASKQLGEKAIELIVLGMIRKGNILLNKIKKESKKRMKLL